MNLYSSIDLLIIDNLAKKSQQKLLSEKLFLIVNNRYNNYLPIVITTNYNRNQLIERLCINKNYSIVDSIISRLYEMCDGIEIKDGDHRMNKILNIIRLCLLSKVPICVYKWFQAKTPFVATNGFLHKLEKFPTPFMKWR